MPIHLHHSKAENPKENRIALTDVRPFILLVFATLMGCSVLNRTLVFNIRSVDVTTASAEPLDRSRLSVNTNSPDFRAQVQIVLQEGAARRFQRFNETHPEETYELRVNGRVLLERVCAQPGGGRQMRWYTTSMEEAQRFAASLNKK